MIFFLDDDVDDDREILPEVATFGDESQYLSVALEDGVKPTEREIALAGTRIWAMVEGFLRLKKKGCFVITKLKVENKKIVDRDRRTILIVTCSS